jgi:hypothetical protein
MKTIKSPPPPPQILHSCADNQVTVIRKIKGLRRYPAHNYPCVLFVLRAKEGTRVQIKSDGTFEFMPNFEELRALLIGIDSTYANVLPATMRNKPRTRQILWRQRNRLRRAVWQRRRQN